MKIQRIYNFLHLWVVLYWIYYDYKKSPKSKNILKLGPKPEYKSRNFQYNDIKVDCLIEKCAGLKMNNLKTYFKSLKKVLESLPYTVFC